MRCFILLSVVLFAFLTFYINRNKLKGKYKMVQVARQSTAEFITTNIKRLKTT